MTSIAPTMTLFAATTGIGVMMLLAGLQKNALEWRRRRRSCPSCGRHIDHRVCSACTAR
jgi:hypothetical protein